MKSLNQLIVLSIALFQKDESLEVLHASEDGQFFMDENRANLHVSDYKRQNAKGLKVHSITREKALKDAKAKKEVEEKAKQEAQTKVTAEAKAKKENNQKAK